MTSGEDNSGNGPDGPCLDRVMKASGLGLFTGGFYGSGAAAWAPEPVASDRKFGSGAPVKSDLKALTRAIVRPAVWFGIVGASFAASECLCEAARNKKDSLNSGFGGLVAGAVMGSVTRRVDFMAATSLASGILMFGVDFGRPSFTYDKETVHKRYDVLPSKHQESEALAALKEKYQRFKDN